MCKVKKDRGLTNLHWYCINVKDYNEIGTKVNIHNKVTGLNRCIVK